MRLAHFLGSRCCTFRPTLACPDTEETLSTISAYGWHNLRPAVTALASSQGRKGSAVVLGSKVIVGDVVVQTESIQYERLFTCRAMVTTSSSKSETPEED